MLSPAPSSLQPQSFHTSGSSPRRNTLHKRKTPSVDKAPSRPVSTASQLKAIEDFLGPNYPPSKEKPKPTPTLSDPALQCLMSLWPEEPRKSNSSSHTSAVRTAPQASKKPSTSKPVLDSPRPPRPQPNPEVERILSQPTLLGRTAQPCIRQIPTSLSSREDLTLKDKQTVISRPRPPPLQVNTTTTTAPILSPQSLDRPIGAKMAKIWYAERDRQRREGEGLEEPVQDQPHSTDVRTRPGLSIDLNLSTDQRCVVACIGLAICSTP